MSAAGPRNPGTGLAAAVTKAARRWAWLVVESRAHRTLAELDEHGLRDIGLDRSEIGSVFSEQAGLVETTRRRLTAGT